ncbi:hypothetical protein DICA2_E32418 [Diutina catenulata]
MEVEPRRGRLPMNYTDMPSAQAVADASTTKAFEDLCAACRRGDVDEVEALLSTAGLDINQVDEWDYSPLILSSLCGHLPVVELLLSRGAVCDRDTFQGARCIYGALTDTIRDLLLSYDISKTVEVTQPFAGYIASLYTPLGPIKDVCFHFRQVHGAMVRDYQAIRCHRFLLAARSTYFADKFADKWRDKVVIDMPTSTDPVLFRQVVDYIYLRGVEATPELRPYAAKLALNELVEMLDALKPMESRRDQAKVKSNYDLQFPNTARSQLKRYLAAIIAAKVEVPIDMDSFEGEVDVSDIDVAKILPEENVKSLVRSSPCDIIVGIVDTEKEVAVYYPVHKAMLARSGYFDTMFRSELFNAVHRVPQYSEDDTGNVAIVDRSMMETVPVVQLSVNCGSPEVAEMLLEYIYHDDVPELPLSKTVDLLFAADELVLDKLKTICAVNISSQFTAFDWVDFEGLQVTGYSGFDLLRAAWKVRSDKLEAHISKMMAHVVTKLNEHCRDEVLSVISESAGRIKARQETDTIEVVDDIRYYLSRKYVVDDKAYDEVAIGMLAGTQLEDTDLMKKATARYHHDLAIIDGWLDELGLEA